MLKDVSRYVEEAPGTSLNGSLYELVWMILVVSGQGEDLQKRINLGVWKCLTHPSGLSLQHT